MQNALGDEVPALRVTLALTDGAGSTPVPTASHFDSYKRSSRRSRLHPTCRDQYCDSTDLVHSTSRC
jgi:hypothetical protein